MIEISNTLPNGDPYALKTKAMGRRINANVQSIPRIDIKFIF